MQTGGMLAFYKWKLERNELELWELNSEQLSMQWRKLKWIKMNFLLVLWMRFVFIWSGKSTIAKCDVFCHAIHFILFRPSVFVCRFCFCIICCSYLQTGIENKCRNILHIKYVRLLFVFLHLAFAKFTIGFDAFGTTWKEQAPTN